MERKPNCICTTPACLECLPVCSAGTYEQNRWSVVAQALTGEFSPYECNADTRIGGIYTGEYDEGYFLPHIQLPQEIAAYAGSQGGNGVLDIYLERIKFGLLTFDSIGTLSDRPPLVTQANFQMAPFLADSIGTKGMYSFADDRPYTFPGAGGTVYMLNSGARSGSAPEGALVSVGADSTASMTSTNASIQATVLGDSGLGKNPLRPFGSTPTAALVTDLQYFLQNDDDINPKANAADPGDPYYGCRARSAVLITDGFPNGDMRGPPVNCELMSAPVGAGGCPYEEVADTVSDMILNGELDKFYVIGFALDGNAAQVAAVEALLNDIALVGGTDQAFLVADRAELVTALSTALNEQNPGATSRTAPVGTGLSPGLIQAEFISGFNASLDSTDPWDGVLERRRIECVAGFPEPQVVVDSDRFQLLLNAQSVAPNGVEAWGSDGPVPFTGGFSRNLWTVLPTAASDINGHLIGDGRAKPSILGLDPPTAGGELNGVAIGEFTKNIIPEYFGLVSGVDDALRDTIVDWVHGVAGSGREDQRLGDIYHSTPAIVGPLVDDLEDRSFNDWRLGLGHQRSPDSVEDLSPPNGWQLNLRPRVIYASTNDGVIHAFLADDYANGAFTAGNGLGEFSCAAGKDAGTELWGFIPPMFLDDLDDLLSGGSKQWFADGSIMVRDLYDGRAFAEDDGGGGAADSPTGKTNAWRTVLFLSFRNGGNGIVALDVTNPCKPEFLWQFTDDNFGDSYGQPTAAQIFLEDSDPTPQGNSGGPVVFRPRQSHGVIIVPGGQGVEGAGSCTIPSGPQLPEGMETAAVASTSITPRTDRRCWRGTTSVPAATQHGRVLYFIDLITGSVIHELGEDTFPAPLNGAVSVFRGDTATVGSVAYTVDADGVLWRIDMSSPDPEDWDALALHDLYYGQAADAAEPTYYPPALTINDAGEVVILVGTGNIDVLDDATAINRVVSITEKLTFDADGFVDTLEGRLNWEVELLAGEQMTGPIELFGGQVFFGSFKAGGGTAIDACPFGGSRIFGLSFLDDPFNPGAKVPLLEDFNGTATHVIDSSTIPDLENSLLVGLQITQRQVCTTTQGVTITDPFDGTTATLAMPSASSGREFRLMGHLSGSAGSVDGLSINVLDEGITAPEGFTVISGMADTLE
jgi:type IV pilus assembly protein PilY1